MVAALMHPTCSLVLLSPADERENLPYLELTKTFTAELRRQIPCLQQLKSRFRNDGLRSIM